LSRLTLALGLALLLVEASVTVALVAASNHETSVSGTIGLAVTAGVAFVISGLVALSRRPENRTGVYLAGVGYLWFLGALSEANNPWVFAIGVVIGSLSFIPFAALLLAHPTGRFGSRFESAFPWIVGGSLVSISTAILLVDSTPASPCDGCPENPFVVVDSPGAADVLQTVDTVVGIVLSLIAVGLLTRRWRRAGPALRRALWPVLLAGGAVLAVLLVGGLLDTLVTTQADGVISALFLVCFAAVPVAFLLGLLRTRLARSSVTDVVVALERGTTLRETLADALGDPTLEIAYRLPGTPHWVDNEGKRVTEPRTTPEQSVTIVERVGLPIAAILHDPSLDESRELVEAVAAAAGLSLHNERLQAELRAEARLTQAVTDTAPSLLVEIGTDGRIVRLNLATLRASGYSDGDEVRGEYFWDVFISDDEREAMKRRFAEAAPDFPPAEYENTFTDAKGEERVIYWRSAPVLDESGQVASIISGGLDITERKRFEEEIRASRVRIVEAEDEARRRLERNLHDGAQQRLVAISVALRLAESKLSADPDEAARLLDGSRHELELALEELRELARGIHPAVLTDRGLRPALESLVARAPIPVELEAFTDRLAPAVEAAAYYVVAEALTNVAKYGQASSASVCVARRNGVLSVTVTDDGVGGANPDAGTGLRGLADRIAAFDGALSVESPPGKGTRVTAEIPLTDGPDKRPTPAPLVDS
jgi:PAS domain S-box-containing protein